jgi:hypothetical protein
LKYKHFTGAVSYTAKSRMPFNLGGALVFQFLNTQWYFITDNWYSVLKPLNSKNVNLRFGINVVVGDKEKVKKEKAEKANEEKKNELLIKSPEMPKDKGSIEDKNETKEAKKLRREQEKIEAQQDKVQEKLLNEQKKAEEKKKKEIERAEKIQKKIDDQKKAEEEKLKQQNPNIEQPNK